MSTTVTSIASFAVIEFRDTVWAANRPFTFILHNGQSVADELPKISIAEFFVVHVHRNGGHEVFGRDLIHEIAP